MKMRRNSLFKALPPLTILAAALILYSLTLDTGLRPDELTGGDLITHQYAQVQARPSNAPGYPLYTMIGWLWFRLGRAVLDGIFNPIQVLSFYSTLWGLGSLWVLYHLLVRPEVTGQNHILAGLLTVFYATTYFFWYYSVTTEQYTAAIFQTIVVIWLAFAWEASPSKHTLLWLAFLSGTMAANMLTTLFILPPLLYLIFSKQPSLWREGRLVLQATTAGLLPLVSYAYVFIRGVQHPEWRGAGEWSNTWDWFIHFISTQQGRDELAPGLTWQGLITPEYPALIWGELTWPVLIGGLIGLILFGRRMTIFFGGTLVIYLCFVTAYRFGNWFQVILPLYPLIVLGFGRSLAWLWQRVEVPPLPSPQLSPTRRGSQASLKGGRLEGRLFTPELTQFWSRSLIVVSLIILLGYRFNLSLPRADQSHRPTDTGLNPGWAILADVAEPGWRISATFEEWVALQYLREIWWVEPSIDLVPPGTPAEFVTKQAAAVKPELIDLTTRYPQAVGAQLIHLSANTTIVMSASATRPASAVKFGDQIQLLGYEATNGGEQVILYWTALKPLTVDYTISMRLWQGGQSLHTERGPLQQDHQPVWNTYPTSQWPPSLIVADAYTFSLPLQADPDHLHIVVYQRREDNFENLGDVLLPLVEVRSKQ